MLTFSLQGFNENLKYDTRRLEIKHNICYRRSSDVDVVLLIAVGLQENKLFR